MKYNWSTPYYGYSYLGEFGVDKHWVSVQEYNSKGNAILCKYFPKCGFHPKEEDFYTVEQAKRAGEKYLEINGIKCKVY